MKEILKKLSQSTFFWNVFNGFIALLVREVGSLPYESVPVIIGALNFLTKKLNKMFNPYYLK